MSTLATTTTTYSVQCLHSAGPPKKFHIQFLYWRIKATYTFNVTSATAAQGCQIFDAAPTVLKGGISFNATKKCTAVLQAINKCTN
jgi:hypothetical protein